MAVLVFPMAVAERARAQSEPMTLPMIMDGPDQGGSMGQRRGQGMGGGYSMVRHRFYMQNGVPPDYRGQVSTLAPSQDAIRDGAVLYAENCASCHGPQGFGDGEAGRDLTPPPANLAHMTGMPMFSDDYLLWTLSEGGEPFGTGMPPFEGVLSRKEIWKVVAFMRAGFPVGPVKN
jgi:mono/diheme cytochrome c family protein